MSKMNAEGVVIPPRSGAVRFVFVVVMTPRGTLSASATRIEERLATLGRVLACFLCREKMGASSTADAGDDAPIGSVF